MINNELMQEALNFKGSGRYKKHNQLEVWQEIIVAMQANNFTVKSILEFILTKDDKLAKLYKDRESTLYSLLCKYIKKINDNPSTLNTKKETIPDTKKNKIFDIKAEKLKYNITDDEENEIRKKYGDKIVNKYGLIFAKSTAGMN